MPADYTYTVVTADSIQLLSKRIIYFKELNPSWDYLGTLIFRESDGASYRLAQDTQAKTFYEGKLCQVFIKKEAAAVGGSIGQNSRKIRLQRKKRS